MESVYRSHSSVCEDARIDGSLRVSVGLEPLPLELEEEVHCPAGTPDDEAPAALIAPTPGRRRRPTRSGGPLGSWAASPTLQRSVGPELPHRLGGPVLARCHRRPGPLSPPLAAGRSPTASVGAWGQRPSPRAAGRSPTALAGAWGHLRTQRLGCRRPLIVGRHALFSVGDRLLSDTTRTYLYSIS